MIRKQLEDRVLIDPKGMKLPFERMGELQQEIAMTLEKGGKHRVSGLPSDKDMRDGTFDNMLKRLADLITGSENEQGYVMWSSSTKTAVADFYKDHYIVYLEDSK